MSGAVNVTGRETRDFLAEARKAWGEEIPDWVEELAREASRSSVSATARRIGKSVGLVSNVIHAKYGADLAGVEGTVRGALMGATVLCPVYDEITRDVCLEQQAKPFAATSSIATRCYRACRSGTCPHSRIKPEGGAREDAE